MSSQYWVWSLSLHISAPPRQISRKSSYIQDLACLARTVPCETSAPLPSLWPSASWGRAAACWSRECGYGEHRGTHCLSQVCHVFPNSRATLWKPTTGSSYFLGNSCEATDMPAPPLALAGIYRSHSFDMLHLSESSTLHIIYYQLFHFELSLLVIFFNS